MFAKDDKKTSYGVSDPLQRKFLAGLFVGIAIGISLGGLVTRLF